MFLLIIQKCPADIQKSVEDLGGIYLIEMFFIIIRWNF